MRFVLLLRRIFGGVWGPERVSAVHRNSYMVGKFREFVVRRDETYRTTTAVPFATR
jgi:hypothetical protein